jgi:nitrite reductase/ring-hydroxylating ferredoxin subunit
MREVPNTLRASADNAAFVPSAHYVSPAFAQAEKDHLWSKVWQIACREEEVPEVGSQIVYDICDETILVVRSAPDRIQAFYNACPHRGRMLSNGEPRKTRELVCPFHGWRFKLDGRCAHIPYAADWGSEGDLSAANLVEVRCERWAGFVFINLDDNAEPLTAFLAPVIERLDGYEFETHRFKWAASVEINCNWKLAIEAFDEAYHVQTTHAQLLPVFDDRTSAKTYGPHGHISRYENAMGLGAPSTLLKSPAPADVRPLVLEFLRQMTFDVGAVYSERDMSAAARILTELPADTDAQTALMATFKYRREAAEAAGVGWPPITIPEMAANGSTWHIFPNIVVLVQPTASLWYRARPHGDGTDPGRCIYEFWALERYAPGYSPNFEKKHYADWRTFDALPPFLMQDFLNLPFMQKGVTSRGFKGAMTNPVQEGIISNYHAHLRAMIGWADEHGQDEES